MFYLMISDEWYHSARVPADCWKISDYVFTDRDMKCIRKDGAIIGGTDSIYNFLPEKAVITAILSAKPLEMYMQRCGVPIK